MLVLVGANGFLGRHMCELLERRGESAVVVSTNPDGSFFERFAPSLRIMTSNEFDSPVGDSVIAEADAIVYFRWRSVPGTFVGEPWRELSENLDPAMTLFLRIADVSRRTKIVFLSSGGTVYGIGAQPQSESSATRPISSHGFGKLLTEEALRFVGRLTGSRYAILRISNAVGRWQCHQSQGIASVALRAVRDGDPVKLFEEDRRFGTSSTPAMWPKRFT